MDPSYTRPIKQLEAQLGLTFKGISRSYTHQARYSYDSPAADLLDRISNIKTRYVSYGLPAIRRSKGIRRKADELFHRLGPELWPDFETNRRPSWLLQPFLELGDSPPETPSHHHYPRRLCYSSLSDRAILAATFYYLICAKVLSYHGNHGKNLPLPSEDVDPLDSECLPNSELSEYSESARSDDECDDESDYSATQSKRTKSTNVTPKSTGYKSMPPYVAPTAPMMGSEQSRTRLADSFGHFDGADQTLGQPSHHQKQNVASGVSRAVPTVATARQPFTKPSPTPDSSRVATPTQNWDQLPERQKMRTGDESIRGTKTRRNKNKTKPYLPPTCLSEDEDLPFIWPPEVAFSSLRSSERADRNAKRTGDETIRVANPKKSKLTEEVPQDPGSVCDYGTPTEQPENSKTTVPSSARRGSDNPTQPRCSSTAAEVRTQQAFGLTSSNGPRFGGKEVTASDASEVETFRGLVQRKFDSSNEHEREAYLKAFVATMELRSDVSDEKSFISDDKRRKMIANVADIFGAETLWAHTPEGRQKPVGYSQNSVSVGHRSEPRTHEKDGPISGEQSEHSSSTKGAPTRSAIATSTAAGVHPTGSADGATDEHLESVPQVTASSNDQGASATPTRQPETFIPIEDTVSDVGVGPADAAVPSADHADALEPRDDNAGTAQPTAPAVQSGAGASDQPEDVDDASLFERISLLIALKRGPTTEPDPDALFDIDLNGITSRNGFWNAMQEELESEILPGEEMFRAEINRTGGSLMECINTKFVMPRSSKRNKSWDNMVRGLLALPPAQRSTFTLVLKAVIHVRSVVDAKPLK